MDKAKNQLEQLLILSLLQKQAEFEEAKVELNDFVYLLYLYEISKIKTPKEPVNRVDPFGLFDDGGTMREGPNSKSNKGQRNDPEYTNDPRWGEYFASGGTTHFGTKLNELKAMVDVALREYSKIPQSENAPTIVEASKLDIKSLTTMLSKIFNKETAEVVISPISGTNTYQLSINIIDPAKMGILEKQLAGMINSGLSISLGVPVGGNIAKHTVNSEGLATKSEINMKRISELDKIVTGIEGRKGIKSNIDIREMLVHEIVEAFHAQKNGYEGAHKKAQDFQKAWGIETNGIGVRGFGGEKGLGTYIFDDGTRSQLYKHPKWGYYGINITDVNGVTKEYR